MKLVLLMGLCMLSAAVAQRNLDEVGFQTPLDLESTNGYTVGFFNNYVNQVDQTDKRLYSQKFWYMSDDFDKQNGPLFLYICGEYTCDVPRTREFPHQLAKKHKGLFLILEHRYYGESQPFNDWSTENLKYLTVENALADTAMFLTYMNFLVQKNYGGPRRKVVVVGGSYPGALSAWMRYKYPHIVDASISSSGVVNAIFNYDMYDYQVYNSTYRSSPECPEVITNMTQALDQWIKFNHTDLMKQVKELFGAESLNDVDFVSLFSDLFAGKVQYGGRTEMCKVLETVKFSSVFAQFNATRAYFGPANAEEYKIDYLKNTTIDHSKSSRQWTYQTCAEVAYFVTPHKNLKMRSELLNIDFYRNIWEQAFGKNVWPNVNHTNLLLGETHLARTNIFFTNGVEDPWKWAGEMSVPKGSGMDAQIVDCEDCAHCVELYTPKDSDAQTLKDARKRIENWLDKILNAEKYTIVKNQIKSIVE